MQHCNFNSEREKHIFNVSLTPALDASTASPRPRTAKRSWSLSAGKVHDKLTGKLLRLSTGIRTSYKDAKASPKPEESFGLAKVTDQTFPTLSKGPGIYPHNCKHREDFQHKETVSSLSEFICQQKAFQLSAVILWTFREEELLSNPHQDPLNEIPGYHVSPLKSNM